MSVTIWPERLSRKDAGQYLRDQHGILASAPTLANLATRGGGPAYRRQGGRLVIYERADLDAWAETKLSQKVCSTAEFRGQRTMSGQPQARSSDDGRRKAKAPAA